MNRILRILMLLVAVAVTIPAGAQIIKRKNLVDINRDSIEHVIIDGDTVPVILPEKNTDVSTEASLITSSSPRVNGVSVSRQTTANCRLKTYRCCRYSKMLISMARCILSSLMCRILCVATSR